jgi:hypothetical protein
MKLLDLLTENKEYERKTHNITIRYGGDVDSFNCSIDLHIKDYDYYVTNPKGVIRDTLETLHSSLVTHYPGRTSFMLISMYVTHYNIPERTWIGLGGLTDVFTDEISPFTRLEVDNMDEHIEQFLSSVKPLKVPTYEECMTSIRNIYKVTDSLLKRKLTIDKISVGLQLFPMKFMVFLDISSFPENETSETLLPKVDHLLKPYNVRVSINNGPMS